MHTCTYRFVWVCAYIRINIYMKDLHCYHRSEVTWGVNTDVKRWSWSKLIERRNCGRTVYLPIKATQHLGLLAHLAGGSCHQERCLGGRGAWGWGLWRCRPVTQISLSQSMTFPSITSLWSFAAVFLGTAVSARCGFSSGIFGCVELLPLSLVTVLHLLRYFIRYLSDHSCHATSAGRYIDWKFFSSSGRTGRCSALEGQVGNKINQLPAAAVDTAGSPVLGMGAGSWSWWRSLFLLLCTRESCSEGEQWVASAQLQSLALSLQAPAPQTASCLAVCGRDSTTAEPSPCTMLCSSPRLCWTRRWILLRK